MENQDDPLYGIKVIGLWFCVTVFFALLIALGVLIVNAPRIRKAWNKKQRKKRSATLTGDQAGDVELGNMPTPRVSRPCAARFPDRERGIDEDLEALVSKESTWQESKIMWMVNRDFKAGKDGEISVQKGDIISVSSFRSGKLVSAP